MGRAFAILRRRDAALDLDGLSDEDPLKLLERIGREGCKDEICVNDLEAPALPWEWGGISL